MHYISLCPALSSARDSSAPPLLATDAVKFTEYVLGINDPAQQRKIIEFVYRIHKARMIIYSCCHPTLAHLIDLYKLTTCLDFIASGRPDEWNRETRSDAHSFLPYLTQFPFIFALVFTQKNSPTPRVGLLMSSEHIVILS